MENAMLTKWMGPALALESVPERVGIPLHVLTGEAVDVARFLEAHWQARRDNGGRVLRPGLEQAAGSGKFHRGLGQEILELQEATQAAQTKYRLAVGPVSESPGTRAELVLGEIKATLEFLFEDGVENTDDLRLERLASAHENPTTHDALAEALDDYAGLARLHESRLPGLGGFDTAMIGEAHALASALREQSARRVVDAPPEEQGLALDLRDRLAAMLFERMQTVRTAARFVFRHDPDIVRKVTSAYQRARVARLRRSRSEEAPVPGGEAPATTE